MKLPIKLQDLLQQNKQAIAATSTLIGQGMVVLDCTGVEWVRPQFDIARERQGSHID